MAPGEYDPLADPASAGRDPYTGDFKAATRLSLAKDYAIIDDVGSEHLSDVSAHSPRDTPQTSDSEDMWDEYNELGKDTIFGIEHEEKATKLQAAAAASSAAGPAGLDDDDVIETVTLLRSVRNKASTSIRATSIDESLIFDEVESRLVIRINARFFLRFLPPHPTM